MKTPKPPSDADRLVDELLQAQPLQPSRRFADRVQASIEAEAERSARSKVLTFPTMVSRAVAVAAAVLLGFFVAGQFDSDVDPEPTTVTTVPEEVWLLAADLPATDGALGSDLADTLDLVEAVSLL
jgi:hypothetical protein